MDGTLIMEADLFGGGSTGLLSVSNLQDQSRYVQSICTTVHKSLLGEGHVDFLVESCIAQFSMRRECSTCDMTMYYMWPHCRRLTDGQQRGHTLGRRRMTEYLL